MSTAIFRAPLLPAIAEILLIACVFFLYAGGSVPDVNESHYLVKAKHYWAPEWCGDDLFLDSADAHLAFYWSVGWLTRLMSLEAFAWCARLLTWLLLAASWQRLSWAIVPQRLFAVLSAALFVGLLEYGHLAGEWVVGGAEAKGFAYVFVLLSLACLVRARWNAAWLAVGAASAFHVLVGGWTGVCLGVAWLADRSGERPRLSSMLPGLIGGVLLSLPGLWPALQLTAGSDPAVVARATQIYVVRRLGHHLDPRQFTALRLLSFFAMLAASCLVFGLIVVSTRAKRAMTSSAGSSGEPDWDTPERAAGRRRLAVAVFSSLVIAAVGWVLGCALPLSEIWVAKSMRYYWFRLSDSFVALGLALGVVYLIAAHWQVFPRWSQGSALLATLLCGGMLTRIMVERQSDWLPKADRHLISRLAGDQAASHRDWIAICREANEKTPVGSVFLTPRWSQTFRWHSGRAEVANWKDIPQDAAAILEWWQRIQALFFFSEVRFGVAATGGMTADLAAPAGLRLRSVDWLSQWPAADLVAFGERYGAGYLITRNQPRLPFAVVATNRTFTIYRLPSVDTSPIDSELDR